MTDGLECVCGKATVADVDTREVPIDDVDISEFDCIDTINEVSYSHSGEDRTLAMKLVLFKHE